MAAIKMTRALALLFTISAAASLQAQAPPPASPPAAPGAAQQPMHLPAPEPKLVFDREVFSYGGTGRRDPFKPLIGKESLGPLFDDLKLKGIIYSSDPARSIVLVQDGSKKLYRAKRGEVIGNSRVVEIRPLAVRFAVENFGMVRYEVLELREGAAAASGLPTEQFKPLPNDKILGGVDFSKLDKPAAKRLLDSMAADRRAKAAKK